MTRSSRTFSVTVTNNAFDWSTPAVGAVSNISPNTLDSVASTFTITRPAGVTGNGVNTKGIYRDSGIAYCSELGDRGSVLVSAGGHNDSANNGTYRCDLKTGMWTQIKAPSNVFRNASAFDVETITGSLLSEARYLEASSHLIREAGSGVPGATHSWSHALAIPSGVLSTGPCLWRAQVGCGWTASSMAQYPFWYTDLAGSNPWAHLGDVSTAQTYLNGSAYYAGAVNGLAAAPRVFFFGSTSSNNLRYATAINLTTRTATNWNYSTQFRNGSGWVTQITDDGVPYFVFLSGNYSDDLIQNGGTGRPRLRLINALTGQLTVVSFTGVTLPIASTLTEDFYYSACWSAERRAIYLTRWVSDTGVIGTDPGVTATSHTSTKVYKIEAPTSFTGTWTVSEQTVAPYYTPDTGSQMRPRSFYVNGCVLNFASTGAPVQAIGVS
jgi:hypothetical protein